MSGVTFLSSNMKKRTKLELPKILLEDPALLRIFETIFEEKEVKPKIRLEHGIEYPKVKDFPEWLEKFQKLIKLNLIERKIIDRVIKCPSCKSLHVGTRFFCPSCKSINIVRTEIIQHVTCGYVDTLIRFKYMRNRAGKRIIVCPNCNLPLREKGIDYRVLGKIFECFDCGRRADNPGIEFVCRDCDHRFDVLKARYDPVYMYRITEQGIRLLETGELLRDLIYTALLSAGFKVEKNVSLKGISGVEHRFDIVVHVDKKLIGIDYRLSSSTETQVTDVLAHIAKFMDFPDIRYIYVTNSAAESAQKVASSQGISLVSGNSILEIITRTLETVKKIKEEALSSKA